MYNNLEDHNVYVYDSVDTNACKDMYECIKMYIHVDMGRKKSMLWMDVYLYIFMYTANQYNQGGTS